MLDAFSTVYELPLTRFKKGQTDKHTDMTDHYTSLYELRPCEVIIQCRAAIFFAMRRGHVLYNNCGSVVHTTVSWLLLLCIIHEKVCVLGTPSSYYTLLFVLCMYMYLVLFYFCCRQFIVWMK